MASIRVIGGSVYPIPPTGHIVIGRDGVCDIVLTRRSVSRKHARIDCDAPAYTLHDLGSNNGTFVNGERVERPRELADGDRIDVHDVSLQFFVGDVPARNGEDTDGEIDVAQAFGIDAEERLHLVLDLGRRLGSTLAVEEILPRVLDLLCKVFPQTVNGEILLSDGDDRLVPWAMKQGREDDSNVATLATAVPDIAKRVLKTGAAELVVGEGSTSVLDSGEADAAVCAPLCGPASGPLGVVLLEAESDEGAYGHADLELLTVICIVAGQAIENVRAYEALLKHERSRGQLDAAREVQQCILPRSRPSVAGYAFHDHYRAADVIGGDYFDYVALNDSVVAVTIADVCGKGLPAALTMAQFSRDVRYLLASASSVKSAIRRLNRAVFEGGTPLVTFAMLLLDSVGHTVSVVVAGHPPPLLRRDGRVAPLVESERCGLPLGVQPDGDWHVTTLDVAPGDTYVLCTDGIIEQFDTELKLFGGGRLAEVVTVSGDSVEEVTDGVGEALGAHAKGAPQTDDRCVVVLKRLG